MADRQIEKRIGAQAHAHPRLPVSTGPHIFQADPQHRQRGLAVVDRYTSRCPLMATRCVSPRTCASGGGNTNGDNANGMTTKYHRCQRLPCRTVPRRFVGMLRNTTRITMLQPSTMTR